MASKAPAAPVAPLISVIICTYRREDLALRAIRSVVQDNSADHEILVVDQDMEGSLGARIRETFGSVLDLRYYRIPTVGLSQARNFGARHAAGRIVVFLDDDAQALPGWLSGYAEAFSQDPTPVMVGGRILPEWEVPKPWWYPSCRVTILGAYDIGDQVMPFPASDLPVGANFAILKEHLERLGGFSEQLGFTAGRQMALGGEDSLIGAQVRQAQGLVLYHPRAVVTHLIRKGKLSPSYFIKRHFIEGRTQIVVMDGVKTLEPAFLLGAAKWHAFSMLGSPVRLCRNVMRERKLAPESLGEWVAATCLSLGVIHQCWRLYRRWRRVPVPGPAPARPQPKASEGR
jgi:GT2 family glycosyltransferase